MRFASAFASLAVTRHASDEKFTFVFWASVRIAASRPASLETALFFLDCAYSGATKTHSTTRTDETIFDMVAPFAFKLPSMRHLRQSKQIPQGFRHRRGEAHALAGDGVIETEERGVEAEAPERI